MPRIIEFDMSDHALPPCSVDGCKRAGGAIINQSLVCAEHAAIEIERVVKERRRPHPSPPRLAPSRGKSNEQAAR